MVLTLLLGALLSASFADAAVQSAMMRGRPTLPKVSIPERTFTSPNGTVLPPLATVYYFNQLKDHNNPSLGTFQQRYWVNLEFYEEGGPIILGTPGEDNAEGYLGYLTNSTINGLIAQQQQGATILIEHRFFGLSNPFDNLTSQSLELLTIQQAIDDLVYFVQNADLPMPCGDNVKPDTTSWVLIGGSYSGALTSWTMVSKPGIFRAGYASSAVVEAILDFYDYFTPIRQYMPKNCSSDVQAVVAYLDEIHAKDDTVAIQNMKEAFGLGQLSHIDDFASALQLNLFDWQKIQPDDGPGGTFFEFCDALEVKGGVSAPPTGWGVEHAISSWGLYWKTRYYTQVCQNSSVEDCLGTYDISQPYWSNITVDNGNRSWFWMVCSQIGAYQVGPPEGQPAIVSRILQPDYIQRQCVNMFPQKFSSSSSPSVSEVDTIYHGWDVNVDRLYFATAYRDPWRGGTVSAPSLHKLSTDQQPIYMSDGFHCSDMLTSSGYLDQTISEVQRTALDYMKEWLA